MLRCEECGFVYADPALLEYGLNDLYQSSYFKGAEYVDYVSDRKALEKNFRRWLKIVINYSHPSHKSTLLEVGCAYGFFLNLARRYFDVVGIDVAHEATAFARDTLGLNVITGNLASHEFGGKFDIICMWDTIEHIHPLESFFGRLAELSKPGAMLFLTTNDIQSVNAKLRKGKWRQIHPPTHVWYFSKETIRLFLHKYGFEVLSVRRPGYHRTLNAMLYRMFKMKGRYASLYDWAVKLGVSRLHVYLNLYDVILVAARRTSNVDTELPGRPSDGS